MKNCIFVNKNYNVYKSYDNKSKKYKYIVHNRNKRFKDAHTHVDNFKLAKIVIYCCIEGVFPDKCKRLEKNYRIVESITRVCTNKYKNRFNNMKYELDKKRTLP